MTVNDFADNANKWLERLSDNPDPGLRPDSQSKRTTLSGKFDELTGDLFPIADDDVEDPRQGIGPANREPDADAVDVASQAHQIAGMDVLAFYKSFRFKESAPFRGKWGIFLLDAGISALTNDLKHEAQSQPRQELRSLAVKTLLAHEQYHFWIDVWTLGQEITPFPLHPLVKRYEYYLQWKRHHELTEYDYEESLANHYAFQRLRRFTFSDGSNAAPALRKVLAMGPIPYSDFKFEVNERARREGVLALAAAAGRDVQFLDCLLNVRRDLDPKFLSPSIQPPDRRHPAVGSHRCPSYVVSTVGYAKLVQFLVRPKLGEFKRFIVEYLNGIPANRTDHKFYKIDNGEKISLPNPHEKEVRPDELARTLPKTGMTRADFLSERERTDFWSRNCPRPSPLPPR